MCVVVLTNKSIVGTVQYITVTLVSWREGKSTWKTNTCSIFCPVSPTGIDCKSYGISGYQPKVYLVNESQLEMICGVTHPSSAEALLLTRTGRAVSGVLQMRVRS